MAAERAAIVTGASSGIGLAISRVLAEEGYALTMAARRPEKLDAAVAGLADDGFDVNAVAANLAEEAEIRGHQVDRAVPRVRGHSHDRLRQGACVRRGHDPAAGHRRVGALHAAGVPGLRRAGDHVRPAGRGALGADVVAGDGDAGPRR